MHTDCSQATTLAGTPYYMSPEVLMVSGFNSAPLRDASQHAGYNTKSDIWSLGCVLYEMCCLEQAFKSEGLLGLLFKICEGEPPTLPAVYDDNLKYGTYHTPYMDHAIMLLGPWRGDCSARLQPTAQMPARYWKSSLLRSIW